MTRRSGHADLPLHGGRMRALLAARMAVLGRLIAQAIARHYGTDELLRRLAHPFWFQAFGSVMGMDWHSSGITTGVLGALKRGLAPIERELGVYVCGGRGRASRRMPAELTRVGARTVAALALVAEVIHGTPSRFTDPARFSLAHGGKDGHPFPVPVKVYDETLRVLKQAVSQARLGRTEKSSALRRLDAHARLLERNARGPGLQAHLDGERGRSPAWGGRTVFDT
jgi:hypothetical protein